MCVVALYWFYIRVSLRILSGACKCEIEKRHCRTATSHRTGAIKGGDGGNRVSQGKGRRKEEDGKERKVSPRCGRTKDSGLGNMLILKRRAHSSSFMVEHTPLFDFLSMPSTLPPLSFIAAQAISFV